MLQLDPKNFSGKAFEFAHISSESVHLTELFCRVDIMVLIERSSSDLVFLHVEGGTHKS